MSDTATLDFIALTKLSIVIPARNEEGCIKDAIIKLHQTLSSCSINHEIIVVDDGSQDATWEILVDIASQIKQLVPVKNLGLNGFGRAINRGLEQISGDAVVIMMADASDDPEDVVRYWQALNQGYDCVFGSRFIRGGKVIDYPKFKLILNRVINKFIQAIFLIKVNDVTNAFKAYRTSVINGCSPLISPHFNLTVELPLKAIVRGYSWTVIPISWRNRESGVTKLKLKEMGSRYLFIILYCWLEMQLSRGDYKKIDKHNP